MRQVIGHPLFLSLLVLVGLYALFAHGLNPPLPRSLLIQYMIICIVGVLLVVSFDDRTAKRFIAPIQILMGSPKLALARLATGIAVVIAAGGSTYWFVKPSDTSPVELRTVHPAPPSSLRIYGKTYNLLTLENPVRKDNSQGSDGYAEAVNAGGELYYKNCIYCHGDLLDGRGHFAESFNPRPANFQDVGTIAQLQESYLFWRITTGGPGLPREGAPWASAMPVWHEMLEEDDVWKIITFLYDYTGHEPRSWELEESKAETPPLDKPGETTADGDDATSLSEEQTEALYQKRCAHCHGEEGDGEGPAADLMYPKPRDFTLAVFKYKSTHADDEFPTDDDFRKTIRDGLTGTAMPGWKSILSEAEIDALIFRIKQFGEWEEEELEYVPIDMGSPVESSPESIEKGRELFVKACVQCHGEEGRGNITSGKKLKDDWENRIWPRNLTRPETWRWTTTSADVYQRISTGIRSTPMPEHTTTMSIEDRWHVANYVMTLRAKAVGLSQGDTVLRAVRVDGNIPDRPDDPAWEIAPAITFALAPNIIKEPRMYFSLNERLTARAVFNDSEIAIQLEVDDRTYSVPGDELEQRYRIEDTEPSRDAVAVQLPVEVLRTSEKPWFRHGDARNPVNMWYWAAPSEDPEEGEQVIAFDASGPSAAPQPRAGNSALAGAGIWKDGRWQIMFKRALNTDNMADLQIRQNQYIPIAFANWDGVAGEQGSRHTFTGWYWLWLEPEASMARLYGIPAGAALFAGLLFAAAARRQGGKYAARVSR